MRHVFNTSTLSKALDKLEPDTAGKWGMLSAQGMVEHLTLRFKASNGKTVWKADGAQEEKTRLKMMLMSKEPFPKNDKGEGTPPDLESADLETAKKVLMQEIEDYWVFFERNPKATPSHKRTGPLSKSEWDHLHNKHLLHHFEQFALLD